MSSFPSSYIPTTTTAVTRNADDESYSAVGNAEDLPLTVSLEFTPAAVHEATLISINDGTADQRVSIYLAGDNTIRAYMETVTAQANVASTTTIAAGTTYKIAAVFAENDVELYVDGVSEGTPDTSCTAASGFTTIRIGDNVSGVSTSYGAIRNVKIFNKRLNDSQIGAL